MKSEAVYIIDEKLQKRIISDAKKKKRSEDVIVGEILERYYKQ